MTEDADPPNPPKPEHMSLEELDRAAAHWTMYVFGPVFRMGDILVKLFSALVRPNTTEPEH